MNANVQAWAVSQLSLPVGTIPHVGATRRAGVSLATCGQD
jgi:hypothetical protein